MNASDRETVLVVDDTPTNVSLLLATLEREGFQVLVATDGTSAIEQAAYARPGLVLLDVNMPGIDGFETCRRLKAIPNTAETPVIFMTASNDLADKIRGFRSGAVDYITKPLQPEEVIARVRTHLKIQHLIREVEAANSELEQRVTERTGELKTALDEVKKLRDQLQAENTYLKDEISEHLNARHIVGNSRELRETLRKVDLVGPTDSSVLILGETGTGKAISAGLVESELFGHLKGAFTGASDRRIGRFELADKGTLFLDEVGELPLDTQAKLLRVLQEGEFEPVGSSKSQRVDVRLIAATNRNLADDVQAGRFRADLYYRLNVFPIEMPPLRSRRDDIPLLVEFFLSQASRRVGKKFTAVGPDSMAKLLRHDWPGNIRDLQNTIERAAILCNPPRLEIEAELSTASAFSAKAAGAANEKKASHGSLEDVERQHIIDVLRRTRGVIEGPQGAAKLLGLKPSTARFRMKKLGITKVDFGA
jgi:DNA-binding NtrC family response regulator